jgi:hypothetical protein
MRRYLLLLTAGCVYLFAGPALAGGFPFDPNRCPTDTNWLPMVERSIPPAVTETLCNFLRAQDSNDTHAAGGLVSPNLATNGYDKFASAQLSTKSRIGASRPPQRFVLDASYHCESNYYQFVFEELYEEAGATKQVINLSEDGRLTGVQFGPW